MKGLSITAYRRTLFFFMGILLIFLVIADILIVTSQRDRIIDEAYNHFQYEIDVVGMAVRGPLLRSDYAEAEQILLQWGREGHDILEVKAVMPNGFVLVHYESEEPFLYPYTFSKLVEYGGRELVSLHIIHDLNSEERIVGNLQLSLVLGSALLTVLMGTALWHTIQKLSVKPLEREVAVRVRSEEMLQKAKDQLETRVRERTAELQDANRSLVQEVEERKKIADQLLFTQFALDNSSESVFWIEPSGKFIYVNNAACSILGYSMEELLEMRVFDIDPNFPQEKWNDHWCELRECRSLSLETIHMRKDGSKFPVEVAVTYLEFEGSELNCAFARDISKRKKAEDMLRNVAEKVSMKTGQEFFQSLVRFIAEELGNDYAFVGQVDEAGALVKTVALYAHGGIADNIEYNLADTPCDNVMGKEACFYPTGIQGIFPKDRLLADMKADSYVGIPLFSNAGKPLGLVATLGSNPIRNEDKDKIVSMLQIFSSRASSEIERRSAVKMLRESEDKFSKAFRSSPTFITISTLEGGTYIDVNDAFVEASGYSREELIGHSALELHIWGRLLDREKVLKQVTDHGEIYSFETQMRMKNGELRTVLYSGEQIHIGNKKCLLAVKLDITERKRLESQLLHAQKMEAVGQLAGGVAHDFNNILTAIISNCHLLKKKFPNSGGGDDIVNKIINLSNNAAKVVQELLVFSRKQKVELSHVILNDLISNSAEVLLDFIGRDVNISTELTDEVTPVMADKNQIEQVLMNLATNARDAMPGGGSFFLRTDILEMNDDFIKMHGFGKLGRYVLLTVADSGSGMDQVTSEKIFEPFFTTKEVGKGTGLGLSIIYGIIKQHRGFISVYSEPGRGTTFKIYLPYIHAAEVV